MINLKKLVLAGTGVAILAAAAVYVVSNDDSRPSAAIVVVPRVITEVENITERPTVGGLVCDPEKAMPVTLLPDIPTPLGHSTIVMTITPDGAVITSDKPIDAKSVIAGELLAAPLPAEMQHKGGYKMILPSRTIVDGGWRNVAYPDETYKDIVFCRTDHNAT